MRILSVYNSTKGDIATNFIEREIISENRRENYLKYSLLHISSANVCNTSRIHGIKNIISM